MCCSARLGAILPERLDFTQRVKSDPGKPHGVVMGNCFEFGAGEQAVGGLSEQGRLALAVKAVTLVNAGYLQGRASSLRCVSS